MPARSPSNSPASASAATVAAAAAAAAAAAGSGSVTGLGEGSGAAGMKRSCTTPSLRGGPDHRRSKSHGGSGETKTQVQQRCGFAGPTRHAAGSGGHQAPWHDPQHNHTGGTSTANSGVATPALTEEPLPTKSARASPTQSHRILAVGRFSAPPTPRRLTRTPRLSPRGFGPPAGAGARGAAASRIAPHRDGGMQGGHTASTGDLQPEVGHTGHPRLGGVHRNTSTASVLVAGSSASAAPATSAPTRDRAGSGASACSPAGPQAPSGGSGIAAQQHIMGTPPTSVGGGSPVATPDSAALLGSSAMETSNIVVEIESQVAAAHSTTTASGATTPTDGGGGDTSSASFRFGRAGSDARLLHSGGGFNRQQGDQGQQVPAPDSRIMKLIGKRRVLGTGHTTAASVVAPAQAAQEAALRRRERQQHNRNGVEGGHKGPATSSAAGSIAGSSASSPAKSRKASEAHQQSVAPISSGAKLGHQSGLAGTASVAPSHSSGSAGGSAEDIGRAAGPAKANRRPPERGPSGGLNISLTALGVGNSRSTTGLVPAVASSAMLPDDEAQGPSQHHSRADLPSIATSASGLALPSATSKFAAESQGATEPATAQALAADDELTQMVAQPLAEGIVATATFQHGAPPVIEHTNLATSMAPQHFNIGQDGSLPLPEDEDDQPPHFGGGGGSMVCEETEQTTTDDPHALGTGGLAASGGAALAGEAEGGGIGAAAQAAAQVAVQAAADAAAMQAAAAASAAAAAAAAAAATAAAPVVADAGRMQEAQGAIVWPGRKQAILEAAPPPAAPVAAPSSATVAVAAPTSAWSWLHAADAQAAAVAAAADAAVLQHHQQQQLQQLMQAGLLAGAGYEHAIASNGQPYSGSLSSSLQQIPHLIQNEAGSLIVPHTWKFVPPPPQALAQQNQAEEGALVAATAHAAMGVSCAASAGEGSDATPGVASQTTAPVASGQGGAEDVQASGLARFAAGALGAALSSPSNCANADEESKRRLLGELVERLAARVYQCEKQLGGEQRANLALRATLEGLQRQNVYLQQQLAYVTQSYHCATATAVAVDEQAMQPSA